MELDSNCKVVKRDTDYISELALPKDVKYFFSNYDSLHMFLDKPYGIKIVSSNEFIPTSKRLYPADDVVVKKAFLHDDPVTRNMPAVKKGHIIVVPAMSLNPSLRNVDAVEMISDQLATWQTAQ